MSEGRSVWRMILSNVVKSLRIMPTKGKLMGEDSLGNKYFEASKNPSSLKKSPPRWFEPKDGEWQQDLPAEWEAWLRGRRKDPPTKEEIEKNLAIANMKKESDVAKSDRKKAESLSETGMKGFPKREEYESEPGKFKD